MLLLTCESFSVLNDGKIMTKLMIPVKFKRVIFCYLLLLIVVSCGTSENESSQKNDFTSQQPILTETQKMVKRLQKLVIAGDPLKYYHWNLEQAQVYKEQLKRVPKNQYNQVWLQYCTQLLNAGKTNECIAEIEKFLAATNKPYEELVDRSNSVLFEVLAMAYLRLGEQENCQNKHTPFSCILPLKTPAIHQLREGSEKAIALYKILLEKAPQEDYKWLINLAYMTLGEYPQNVPKKYLLQFPNKKEEQLNFPGFLDVAANVGVAQDGLSGGTCIEDFNGDGLLDIFATSYGMKDQVKLFLNNGKGSFDDVTEKSGLIGIVSGLNTIHADYDNDGDRDILILRGGWLGAAGNHPNSLLRNNGNGTFEDVTESAGLLTYHPTKTAAWADFNRDGFLDLFIGNESRGLRQPHACELFQNNGDGTFTEVANEYGLGQIRKFVKGVTWGDINNDNWPELYLSVMGDKNLLFKNNNGQFEEIGEKAKVEEPIFSFPCWFWDVNHDGYQDLFVSGYDARIIDGAAGEFAKELAGKQVKSAKPRLYLNQGDETFKEVTKSYGISKTMFAMGSNFGDLDNDGFFDFYVGTGAPDFKTVVPNRMFRNVVGKRFEEVTSAGGFGHIQKGHGIAFADIDLDGDQDIYAVMGGAYSGDTFTNVLFENPIEKNNWITIKLEGTTTNKDAIGSVIELELQNGEKRFHTIGTGGSFGSSSLQAEIGLGQSSIAKLSIHWQNGNVQEFKNIKSNQIISIQEGGTEYQVVTLKPIPFTKNENRHSH